MRMKLGEILVSNRILTPDQLDLALKRQFETKQPLGTVLVQMELITEILLLQVLAAQQSVSPWLIDKEPPHPDALALVPIKNCVQYQMLPVQIRGDLLVVAMRNPGDLDALDFARNVSGLRIEPVLADDEKLANLIRRYEQEGLDAMVLGSKLDEALSLVSDVVDRAQHHELEDEDERPVVALVNQILTDAIRMGASDIHIEPRGSAVELRCRLDGELVKVRDIPSSLHQMLTTRVKIMAELDIVESRLPQNGRVSARVDGRTVDLRISTLPNLYGERIVLRILDKNRALVSLDHLGFAAENLALFRELCQKPYGIFLVTGPTGSGKTTSLYAALNELKSVNTNIMTCEDPIEYDIPGLNQSQVNEKVGLNYDTQLKAILRQDPDIVLVGEIRDKETAITTVRAALTGHLVFSTLHTNDAPSALPRLIEMGVEPHFVASSLIGVMSQRLVRKICPDCAETYEPDSFERALLEKTLGRGIGHVTLSRGQGCATCFSTGYRGRTAIHEVMPMTNELRDMMAENVSLKELRHEAAAIGYRTMQQDVLNRVLQHEISMSEALANVYFDTIGIGQQNSQTCQAA